MKTKIIMMIKILVCFIIGLAAIIFTVIGIVIIVIPKG